MMPLLLGTSIQGTQNWTRKNVHIVCFPFCQTNQLETSEIIKRKSGKTVFSRNKVSNRIKRSIYISTEILTTASQSRAGNENFGNGTASFGQSRPTGEKEDPLWRWTTLNGKFPRSICFSTKISEIFGIIESTHNLTSIEGNLYSGAWDTFSESRDPGLTSIQGTPKHSGSLWTTI